MKIYSHSIQNGYFADPFGHRGQYLLKGMPNRSFHLAWEDLPPGTKTLALTFIDHDAIPVCGFTWIHWCVANIDPNTKELPENASQELKLLQGVNSWASGLLPADHRLTKEEASCFGGCAPPDTTHNYIINLYALDKTLNLKPGFFYNELLTAMEGHLLGQAEIQARYKSKDS